MFSEGRKQTNYSCDNGVISRRIIVQSFASILINSVFVNFCCCAKMLKSQRSIKGGPLL